MRPARLAGILAASVDPRAVIAPLFAALHDPSDLATLYEGRTGSVAASVDGPVGQMLDVSGNGHTFVAKSDAGRPILRQSGSVYWLEFAGTDDAMEASYTQSAYPITLCASAEYSGGGASLVLLAASSSDAAYKAVYNTGGFWAYFDSGTGSVAGTETVGTNTQQHVLVAPFTSSLANLIQDGVDNVLGNANTNTFGSVTRLDLGKRSSAGTQWFIGKFFGGGAVASTLTLAQRKQVETWLSIKNGRAYDVLNGLIAEGDSITSGSAATGSNGYVQQLRDAAPRFGTLFIQAVSGNKMADIAARLSTTTSRATAMIAAGLRPIVTLLTGANDRPTTVGAAQTLYDAITSYVASVRASGAKVVLITPIASDPATYAAWMSTGRPELIRLMRLNAAGADAIADLAAAGVLDTYGGGMYPGGDLQHPNDAGHAAMLPVVTAAVLTVRATSYA